MKTDVIGEHALHVHAAWIARNSARLKLRKLLAKWLSETGEWYDREEAHGEPGAEEIEDAIAGKKATQQNLTRARSRLNRLIRREIGDV